VAELAVVLRGVAAMLPHGQATIDLGIASDGRIAALGEPGTLLGRERVDANGLIAIPGGVDLHVHINTFFGGSTTRDDFFSGTAAALFGGTTTIAQFAIPRPGETSADAVERTHAEARPDVLADYAVHGAVVRESFEISVDQFASLRLAGIGTVKIFSAYTDVIGLSLGQIHRLLAAAALVGITVFVHAETDSLIREGVRDAVERSELGPRGHATSRTPLAESDALRSISDLAEDAGARVYFVHVSGAKSVEALAVRRGRGEHVLAETCPHYLFLDASVYDDPVGQRWICSPPIRGAEDRTALWDGLRTGVIDAVSSDHNCFDIAQKDASAADFRTVPNGLPGIETRLPLLIGAALDGRLEWRRVVEVSSETPARILGLWPRKGALVVGADADIVLVDPTSATDLGAGHMAGNLRPFAGMQSSGGIVSVYRRGEAVIADGGLRASRGSGLWLATTSPAATVADLSVVS
jgi:dihydropyrimidinase